MDQSQHNIRQLVRRVRARWRRLVVLRATGRTALTVSCALGAVLCLAFLAREAPPVILAGLAVAAVALTIGSAIWGLWPAREVPSDGRVARFIEEQDASLDDQLVSAVDLLAGPRGQTPAFARSVVAEADRRAAEVDPTVIVPTHALRRATTWAVAALLLASAVAFFGREPARRSFDALSLVLFPSHVRLEVVPGDVRVTAGAPLIVEARLVGSGAPNDVQLFFADGAAGTGDAADAEGEWRATEMTRDGSGTFKFAIESVNAPFRYRVAAGSLGSPVYGVSVARAPRVTRIDVEYAGASALGFEPRVETDSGDIFAPAGTDVRLMVHTDVQAATGQMTMANGEALDLKPDGLVLSGSFKVIKDTSYRVALADAEGLANPGDVEYFIRTLEDRPPDVQLLKPARDREVTQLEEVDIAAQARDDFGVDRLDLVYSKGGGPETVVPLPIERRATSVTGAHTLQLENLDLRTGDFVSYYVRARDVARGRPASEARSDIFFLHVRPFEQEFTLAGGQSATGGGNRREVDDVVTAQKEIIVATWKLDRRARVANSEVPKGDIRSVSLAEAELKARVEETSSSFRASVMRDPRRSAQPAGGGSGPSPQLRAGQTLPEEDAMAAAVSALGRAVTSLDRLQTAEALPHQMEALNQLLKAQGDVRKRTVGQQAGNGSGDNRNSQDLSGMFDRELQREQQTNTETPKSTERPEPDSQSTLDRVKDLARRQDELLRNQEQRAGERAQMTPEQLKAEFEKLAREQSGLGQRAEEMAQQMGRQQQGQPDQGSQSGQSPGQTSPGGGASAQSQQMRAAAEEMKRAAGELGRQDPAQAAARGSRALGQLRQLEQDLNATGPDERRRALGEMQLEASQLADAQRRVSSEATKADTGEQGRDTMRRLAGEQDRLADRTERLQDQLREQAESTSGQRERTDQDIQRAAADAAQEIERQHLTERMEQAAGEMRSAAGRGARESRVSGGPTNSVRMAGRKPDRIWREHSNRWPIVLVKPLRRKTMNRDS